MNDRVKFVFGKDFVQSLCTANIRFVEFEQRIVGMPCDIGAFDLGRIKRIEIIYSGNPEGAFRQQFINQMRADKSRSACY